MFDEKQATMLRLQAAMPDEAADGVDVDEHARRIAAEVARVRSAARRRLL